MADFGHLMSTMDTIKNPGAPPAKKPARKKEPSAAGKSPNRRPSSSSAGVKSITNPTPTGDGTVKKKKKKKPEAGGAAAPAAAAATGGKGSKEKKKKKKKPAAGAADAAAVPQRSAASRLGGPTIQKGLAAAKTSKKVAKALAVKSTGPDLSKKSKIWLALNPQALAVEDPKKKKADDDERNIVLMRGGGGLGVLDMDDSQMDRDEFGAIVEPDEDEDEDDFGFEEEDDGALADFDPETMKMLQAKRDERAKEENARRAKLKAAADKVKAEKEKKMDAAMAVINKQKAAERKQNELSDKDVANAQRRMSSEIAFDFNFK